MSPYDRGGGFGSSGGGLPAGITQAQLDEIKSFNAGLTQAGNKSRPSRSRSRGGGAGGSGISRGTGSGTSSARLGGSYSSATSTSRSGSGAGYGGGASYSVGPTTASPITKPAARENVPIHLRGAVDVSKTRWANLDSTGAGTLGNHSIGPLNSVATPPTPRSRSPTRSSILTPQRPQPSPPKLQQQPPAFHPLQNIDQGQNPISRIPTPPGRVRIVTNMTPDDPSKPFIPAHFRQTSCRETIEEMARMAGIRKRATIPSTPTPLTTSALSEITSDGMSIPAHPNQVLSARSTFAPVAATRQPDVDQQNWLNLTKTKKQDQESHTAVANPIKTGSPDVSGIVENAQPMLSESRWAPRGNNTAQHNGFASASSTAPASTAPAASEWVVSVQQPIAPPRQAPCDNGWAPISATSQVTPSSSGWGQPQMAEQQVPSVQANSSTSWDTIGNNRWTQGQPDHTIGNAPPAQVGGFDSGSTHVQAPSANAGGFGNISAVQPCEFGAGLAQGGTLQYNASGFGSGLPAQPASFGASSYQGQSASSNNGGVGGTASVQSAGFASVPAQAIPFPLLNPQGPPAQSSGWGAASHGFQGPNAQGVSLAAPNMTAQAQAQCSGGWGNVANQNPTAFGPSGHNRIPSQSMSDVEMTGGNSILDNPVGNPDNSSPANQMLPTLPTSADYHWATPSWNVPQAVATGFGRPSQGPAQESASVRQFENTRQPSSEAGTSNFSFINPQNTTVNNGWPTAASVSSTVPAKPHPFGFDLAEFNNRVTRELREVDTNTRVANPAAQPALDSTYGPAHLRPAPQSTNRTIQTRSAENIPPKTQEKVKTLKDSRWA